MAYRTHDYGRLESIIIGYYDDLAVRKIAREYRESTGKAISLRLIYRAIIDLRLRGKLAPKTVKTPEQRRARREDQGQGMAAEESR